MRIAFLVSGHLGYFTLMEISNVYSPSLIVTDSKSIEIINYAYQNGIPLFIGNPRDGRLYQYINGATFDLILSINYLFIIEQNFISSATYAINIHGSLLPKYRGRTPHVWAIINNEKITGISAHLIEEECDAGDIILQKEISIEPDDTGRSILSKFEVEYPKIVFEIVKMASINEMNGIKQDSTKATFFTKRTSNDGEINWHWQRERIHNWVRAQSRPYPGAFTYYKGNKIIVYRVEVSEFGFHQNDVNGKILSINENIIVKTPNGAIALTEIEIVGNSVVFTKGENFHAQYKN